MRTDEILPLAGITYRQLDHWTRKGYLGDIPAPGSGNQRYYTDEQVEHICIMARMVRSLGMPPVHASIWARMIAAKGVVKIGPFVICDVGRNDE